MDSSQTQQKELRKVLQDMKNGEGCTICKFVRIFALIVLILVALFVFFMQTNKVPLNEPLSPDKAPKITPQQWDQHILELGASIHPTATGTKIAPPTSGVQSPTQPPPPTTFIPSKK